jgi:two-component system chemotaxis sensor kinase CheA
MQYPEQTALDPEIIQAFKMDAAEQLERFREILLNAGHNLNPQGDTLPELFEIARDIANFLPELFRIAHNIKGSSGMMGLNELKETLHAVENLLDEARHGRQQIDASTIELLLNFSQDAGVYAMCKDWAQTETLTSWRETFVKMLTPNPTTTVAEAQLVLSAAEELEIRQWQETGHEVYGVEVIFAPQEEMPGATTLVLINALKKSGIIYKTAPDLQELRNAQWSNFKIILQSERELSIEEEQEIVGFSNHGEAIKLRRWTYRPDRSLTSVKYEYRPVSPNVKIEYGKIEKLTSASAELDKLSAGLFSIFCEGYSTQTWSRLGQYLMELEQASSRLKDDIRDIKMVPAGQLFKRAPVIVRDLSQRLRKSVQINCSGEEIELDKRIAEQMADPLLHLVRNSIDHGLEELEERRRAGKPEQGTIILSARYEGEKVILSVGDDGRGLDLPKIRERAIINGLIQEHEQLSENELKQMIFAPGFSTADKVSDISGRGVGLDIVQSSVWALQGEIQIESVPGLGTTFRLVFPLHLKYDQSFLVRIGGQNFAIPTEEVLETLELELSQITCFGTRVYCDLHGEKLPLLNLCQALRLKTAKKDRKIKVLVLKGAFRKVGLIVEETLGNQRLTIRKLDNIFSCSPLIAGASVLDNGEIVLVLDSGRLLDKVVAEHESSGAGKERENAEKQKGTG